VIVKVGNTIAEAANQVTATNDPTAHAEILAIRAACAKLGVFDLLGCEIYTSCEPLPHVPGRNLLGPALSHIFRQRRRRRIAYWLRRFLIYPRDRAAAYPAHDPNDQLMREESWQPFEHGKQSPTK